jgi:mevalonate kinase
VQTIEAVERGLDIKIKSQIPYGVGLGSSAAACVATVGAIDSMGVGHDKDWICRRAIEAEQTIHKISSGADCNVSTYGGIMRYSKQDGYRKIQAKGALNLVLSSTGIRHSTGDLVEKVRKIHDAAPSEFKSIGSQANEICKLAVSALESGDHTKLGKLMSENQALLEKIGVSHTKAAKIIKIILDSGGYGAKMTGAGGGGAVIGLTSSPTDSARIAKRLNQFGFESAAIEVDVDGLVVK